MPDYATERTVMERLVTQAAEIARTFQEKGFEAFTKAQGDPYLTEADLAIDTLLREGFGAAFPDDGWFSEETEDDGTRTKHKRCWIVDPIDGTRDFVMHTGHFSISVGLVDGGVPVLGCVCAPMQNQMMVGVVGQGAFLNGSPVTLDDGDMGLGETVCEISTRDFAGGRWSPYMGRLQVKPLGSIAYKVARVGVGLSQMTASLTPKCLWDICGGHAVAAAAGCVVSDLYGHPIRYDGPSKEVGGLVVAPPRRHDQAMRLFQAEEIA